MREPIVEKPAPSRSFRFKVLEKDLIFTPENGNVHIIQDEIC